MITSKGFPKQIKMTPAKFRSFQTLPAGFGFQVEVKLTDDTDNALEAIYSKALELIISGVVSRWSLGRLGTLCRFHYLTTSVLFLSLGHGLLQGKEVFFNVDKTSPGGRQRI